MPAVIGPSLLATILETAIVAGISYYYNRYQRKKQERAARKRLPRIDAEYTGALEPRRRLYGNFRAAGLNVLPAITSGNSGEHLHKAMVISEGNLDAITSVQINNDVLTASDILANTIGKYTNYLQISMFDGTQSWELLASYVPVWTTDQDGFDLAGVYCRFVASNTVYDKGVPQVIVSGRGLKIYDPRLDTSPGANPTSGTYKAFSTSPPLQLVDFLIWESGGAELPSNIRWSDVVTAANDCAGSVTIPTGTQSRFTSSVEVYAPQTLAERTDTIRMLAQAMLGICWFSGGLWRMRANVYRTPSGSITDADYLEGSDRTWQTAQSLSNGGTFNAVRGSFVDDDSNRQPVPFPEVTSATFEAEDGERRYKDVEYKACANHWEAQRNAILEMRQVRTRQTISGTFRFRVWKFELWDVVPVTLADFGWTNVIARIVGIRLKQNFTVDLDLEAVLSTDYTDPTTPEYTTPSAVGYPASATFKPGAPQNVRVTSVANGLILEWDPPANAPGVLLYQVFRHTSSTPFSSASQVGPDTAQNSMVIPLSSTTVGYYWVRAKVAETGQVGTQAPPSNGVPGNAASATGGLSAVVTPGSATVVGYSASLTTPTVTVTPIGGTGPYTYAATLISGSGITINNGTTTTPSFSATGLAEGETRTGTVKITVTDSVAAAYDVNVAVTITRDYNVTLNNATVSSSSSGFSPAVSQWTISSNNVYHTPTSGLDYAWISPSGTPSNFDVRFTLTSGVLASPSLSTGVPTAWTQLGGAAQQLQQIRSTPGTDTGVVLVEIRNHGVGSAIASCSVTLTATKT